MPRKPICRAVPVEIMPTVGEIAEHFCDMDADEQARFFSFVAEISDKWRMSFCFQLQAIIDSKVLTPAGRRVMEQMGEYGACEECDERGDS